MASEQTKRLWGAFAGLSTFAKFGLIAAAAFLVLSLVGGVGLMVSHYKDQKSRELQAEEAAKRYKLERDYMLQAGALKQLQKEQVTIEETLAAKDRIIEGARGDVRAADAKLDKVAQNATTEMAALPDADDLTPDEWRKRLRQRFAAEGIPVGR